MRLISAVALGVVFSMFISTGYAAVGSKEQLAVRAELDTIRQDRPFYETATATGRCRDIEEDIETASGAKQLYRVDKKNDSGQKVKEVGVFYIDEHGRKCICFDERGIEPLAEKNIRGERVAITGHITSGKSFDVDSEIIVLVDSLELIKVILQ